MKHAALYVRVSTQEQKDKGLSVENQLDSLVKFCEQNDYSYEIYNDAGISGAITYKKRPQMCRLIQDCKAGKVDIILFTRLDRFFRSMKDYYIVMDMVNNVEWNAIWQEYNINSATGRFYLNMSLSVAQMESDIDSERIKSVLDYKREMGQYIGNPPFGYKRVNGYLVKDEKTKDIVERIWSKYLETFSVAQTREQFDRSEFFLSESRFKRMVKNPVYYGQAQLGACEPYITKEQWDMVQDMRRKHMRTPKENHVYLFTGLMKCGICGRRMHSCFTQPNGTTKFKQYFCRRSNVNVEHPSGVSISEKKIERYLLSELDQLLANISFEAYTDDVDTEIEDYEKKKKRIESKLERIKMLYIEGDMELDDYREKKQSLIDELGTPPERAERPSIELPDNWGEIYEQLSEGGKKAFWANVVKEIVYEKGHAPIVRFR